MILLCNQVRKMTLLLDKIVNCIGRKNFATGSSVIPPLGLNNISVSIGETDTVHAATCTCINSMRIPAFDDVDTFHAVMDSMIDADTFTSLYSLIIWIPMFFYYKAGSKLC